MDETKETAANTEQPAVYTDIYQAPKHWRLHRGARLSVDQINEIIADAYANMLPVEPDVRQTAIPDFGGARARFEETHSIEKGFWVEKKENSTKKGEAN